MKENWFVCFENDNSKVQCYGGFSSPLEADAFYGSLETHKKFKKSSLIPACSFLPTFIQQYQVKSTYNKIFNNNIEFKRIINK